MAVLIRPAVPPDIPYLYEICLKTGDAGRNAQGLFYDPLLLGQYFAAPYFFYDISLCFIIEENRMPRGYLIGTDNTNRFYAWMENNWLPPLRERYPQDTPGEQFRSANEHNLVTLIHYKTEPLETSWIHEYPAHLHIDLLPSLQGKGYGKKMMKCFEFELVKRHCPGIHLGVDGRNHQAIGFYEKLGFIVLEEMPWGFRMGKSLQ